MNESDQQSSVLRGLPSTDRLVNSVVTENDTGRRRVATTLAREVLQDARDEARRTGRIPDVEKLAGRLVAAIERGAESSLRRVINATAASYTTLEYDQETGRRSSRYVHTRGLLRELTGAADAIVVNNNAAAVMLVLSALCRGREVIVSRGQLVEIGGGFRIPDILAQSGARLVEVGTTNRTYARDYEHTITPETAAMLRVHPSNFRIRGFTHDASLPELAAIARQQSILLIDDLGSGSLLDTSVYGLDHEPMVQESVAAGSDAVCFSGDKLLGGPQAGIIVGTNDVIAAIEDHPLTRALRVDKMTLAALEATLRHYAQGSAIQDVPVWQMISASEAHIRERAEQLLRRLRGSGVGASLLDGRSMIGGGSLPEESLATSLLCLPTETTPPDELAARLRRARTPVIARILDDRVVCDLRTVLADQEEELANVLVRVLGADRQ